MDKYKNAITFYRSKYFKIEEFVPPEMIEKKGALKCWEYVDIGLMITFDQLKEDFPKGTISLNTWLWGGDRTQSGIRTSSSKYYNMYSMHPYGKAGDALLSDYDINVVRKFIIDNPGRYPYVKGIELGTSWLHLDVRNREKLITFRP